MLCRASDISDMIGVLAAKPLFEHIVVLWGRLYNIVVHRGGEERLGNGILPVGSIQNIQNDVRSNAEKLPGGEFLEQLLHTLAGRKLE